MSYEVFIDVEHHPRHADDWARKESTCFKWADLPEGTDELVYVVNGLREMADALDPRVLCTNCEKTRGEHHREGNLYRCFNRLGPVTQSKWWSEDTEKQSGGDES